MSSVFKALSDPTRRRVLQLLRKGPMSAGDLSDQFDVSKPTMSAHFAVLREAGLVTMRAEGQKRIYALNVEPLSEIWLWMLQLAGFWNQSLDKLEAKIRESIDAV